ncbi:MAG: ABC transporter ATP-binding protein [Saprospiraceae bacterium]|nr:ABC transporter ATP-binding protein [Saprospiraceae bacterium]
MGNHLFTSILLSVLITLSDSIGIGFLVSILQQASNSNGADTSAPFSLSKVYYTLFQHDPAIYTLIIIAIIFFLLKGLLTFILYAIQAKMTTGIISKTRINILNGVIHLKYRAYTTTDTGTILNISTAEVSKLNYALQNYLNASQYIIMSVAYICIALFVDPPFSIIIILLSLFFLFFYSHVVRYFKKLSQEIVRTGNQYNSFLSQILNNFKYLKTTNIIYDYSRRIKEKIDHTEKLNYRFLQINAITNSAREPIVLILLSTVILLRYFSTGTIGISMVFTMLLFYRTLNYFLLTQSNWQSFQQNSGSVDKIISIQDDFLKDREKMKGNQPFELRKRICLSNIRVELNGQSILSDINLSINKNTTVAFAGPSGAGKTTLASVISGLISPDGGVITIDDVPFGNFDLDNFRTKIGFVSQDPTIFSDTIFNNITLWSEKSRKNIEKFSSICRMTHLDEWINGLSEKEDSLTGDFGISLSGGQKQRICIARELYREVELLVFDEATSSLDAITEQIIQENINSIKGKMTIIIIAHRLSTIKYADTIFLLENGRIAHSGTYAQLLASSAIFQKMVSLQSD